MTVYPIMRRRRCPECGGVLTNPWQTRFCSRACRVTAWRIVTRPCAECGTAFVPQKPSRRWCSRACYHGRLLPLLRQCAYTWMTASDLALLLLGEDGEAEIHAIRQALLRLRRQGYVIETCAAWWLWSTPLIRPRLAYRLIETKLLETTA